MSELPECCDKCGAVITTKAQGEFAGGLRAMLRETRAENRTLMDRIRVLESVRDAAGEYLYDSSKREGLQIADESMNTWCENHGHDAYCEIFVRDWRVAGALMENVTKPATDPLISLAGAAFELLDTNMWDWYGDRKVFLDWRPK